MVSSLIFATFLFLQNNITLIKTVTGSIENKSSIFSINLYNYQIRGIISALQKQNLKQGRGANVDLLFVDPKEKGLWPYSQRKVQGLVKKVCKAAGLSVRNPHDLRHTYATLLLMAHQSPGYVQKQLGHSSISITMDIYCHWIPGEGRGGLEAALGAKKVVPNRARNLHILHIIKNGSSK